MKKHLKAHMKTCLKTLLSTSLLICLFSITSQAAEPTFSNYWYQDTQGSWHIKDQNGKVITNAWLCDDAVSSNGQDIWYLIDTNGNMVSAGLVQDQTGNIYSLETSHNGYYGMLRYQSGVYDGVYLDLEGSHGGSFAKIKNQDGLAGLQGIYGLTQVNIDNSNCVYTSSFANQGNSNNSNYSNNANQNNNDKYANESEQLKKDRQDLRDLGFSDELIDQIHSDEGNYGNLH